MLGAFPTSRPRGPDEGLAVLARWLANQRAIPTSMTEATAWQLLEEARGDELPLEGPSAPLIVQPRFSLWLVGQLGGRPQLHVFASEEAAASKARELGAEMKVPVLLIDRGGDITERFDPPQHTPVMAPANPLPQPTESLRAVAATSPPPVPPVPPAPEAPMNPPIAAKASVSPPIAAKPRARSLTLKVDKHENQWAVFLEGRVIATAPSRDKARLRAKMLKEDPDFVADPRPVVQPQE